MNGWRIFLIIFVGLMFTGTIISTTLYAEEYSLEDLYRIGLEQAEKIKVSEEDLYIAERGKDKALALLLPKLSAFGNYTGD
jgi:outer membrane protein TolC